MAEKKKVVVIGGGIAGTAVAKGLENDADVTLVDPKEYFEITFSELRSMVEPSFADRSLVLHKDYLKKAKVVIASAERISATEVFTNSGDTIPYDYLVITTGTTFDGLKTKAERIASFEASYKKIVDSESVLVIGGGPVGVELVGEIVTDFPQKKVTLVHSGKRLIEFLGTKAADKTLAWLKSKGVEVILNDRVDIQSAAPPDYETSKHVKIKANNHFVTIGKKLGSDWLLASPYIKDKVVDGHLQVENTLQVSGLSNVFCAGDLTHFKEIKQGFVAANHAKVVISNIKKLIKNPDAQLGVYKPLEKAFGIVSLGRSSGVAQLPIFTVLGWLPAKLKSGDFFVGKTRQSLGLKAK